MQRFGWFVLIWIIIGVLTPPRSVLAAKCPQSRITTFTITVQNEDVPGFIKEGDLVRLGNWLEVHVRANCGKVRVSVNGVVQDVASTSEMTTTIKTEDYDLGELAIEVRARDDNDSSWNNAVHRTITIETGFMPERLDYSEDHPTASATPDEGFSFPPGCSPLARLKIGDRARVSDETPDPLPLRGEGDEDAAILDQIPVNTILTIKDGPVCRGRFVWWKTTFKGQNGWVAETNYYNNYNLLPVEGP
jgi:hypothetical protein